MPIAIDERLLAAAPVAERNDFAVLALPEGEVETL
jgi:hypothetical protein